MPELDSPGSFSFMHTGPMDKCQQKLMDTRRVNREKINIFCPMLMEG